MSQTKKYISLSKLGTYHAKNKAYIDSELQTLAGEMLDVVEELDNKIDSNATHNHDTKYDTKGSADTALETANAYTDEQVGALNEGFSDVIYQMYGSDLTEDGAPTIRQIAGDEANKVQGSLDEHKNTSNPHKISKSTIGLGNVDNTSDVNKPVSTAQATAIADAKKAGTDAKSAISTHTADKSNPHGVTAEQIGADPIGSASAVQKNLDDVEDKVDGHIAASNPHGITKATVGLGNVNNTSDANKPVSTAQAAAIKVVQDDVDALADEFSDHKSATQLHFTQTERNKLAGIAENANNYSHPNSGVSAGSYTKVTVNAQGHVTGGSNPTTLAGYGITDAEKSGAVSTHNSSSTAHSDIRNSLTALSNKLNAFFEGVTDTTKDQLYEVLALIDANSGTLESLTTSKVDKSSIVKALNAEGDDKVLSATYGQLLQASIADGLSGKVDKVSGKGLSTNDFTAAYKTKLDGITAGAEVNQNAFSNIVVGSTTVAADSKTDSLTLEGSNVTITADATNDKVTFSVADGSTSVKGLVKLTNSTSSTSTTTAATPSSVKSAYDLADTANTAAGTAQTKANSAYDLANTANTTANTNKTNLSSHTGSTNNPHSVTKAQVGLGNVPNVATNDQTPTYTAASSLTALTSGEKLSVSMGKLSKAVSTLISHLDASNPHGISKSTIGLGNVDNTADADKTVKAAGTATTATTLSGLTATIAELNILDGVTATAAEINKLDGLTATTAQLNKTATLSTVATSGSYNDLSNKPSIPTVYTESQCTTFTSDAGTVTPLAVQKAAKMFAITRPSSTVANTIARYSNTTGDVKSSTIKIEDVTNTKDSSQKAEVISIPVANGTKKMVYGYCTDQVDGTSFIGGLFDADATEFPYASGLAIGGSSGNLLWKGAKVAVATDIPTKLSQFTNDSGFKSTNATTSASGLMAATDKTKLDATNVAYGTCSTAAGTAAKVITVSGNTNWALTAGSFVTVVFSATNTAENPTLNINGTGAKNVYYNGSQITTSSLGMAGTASTPMTFMYDGSKYIFVSWGKDNNTTYTNVKLGHGYATCDTAASTVAKVATLSSYTLTTGGIVAVKFTNAVPAGATLNINSKGAKPIYYKGKAIVNGVVCAGEVATFIYSGGYYHLLAVDRNRFYTSLVPYGTSIEASETATVDLNTPDYMKVGNYFCSANAKAKYVSNIPKKDTAFMMQVYSPLSQTVDDESGAWKYRLRKIMYYTGEEYTQYCYTDGTGGNWLYGAWKKTVVDTDTATTSKAGLMSAADKTKLDGLQGGGGFDFDALINASGYSYTYVKSTGVETISQGSTTYATRTSTKNASTGVWTVVTVCSAAGVNVTKTYTPSSTGWTVA